MVCSLSLLGWLLLSGVGLREVVCCIVSGSIWVKALVAERAQADAIVVLVIEQVVVEVFHVVLPAKDRIHVASLIWIEIIVIGIVSRDSIELDIVDTTDSRLLCPIPHFLHDEYQI